MVSDKASACPNCGCPMGGTLICPECGAPISSNAHCCDNCGCPIHKDNTGNNEGEWLKNEPNNKRQWIWALIAVMSCLLAGGVYYAFFTKNKVASEASLEERNDSTDEKNAIVELTPEFIKAIEKYDQLSSFSEGYAAVYRIGKGGVGYINTKGEEIIPCNFDEASNFHEGLANVKKDGKFGLINKKGEVFYSDEKKILCVGRFSEGFAFVLLEENNFCVIDNMGRPVFKGKCNSFAIYNSDVGGPDSESMPFYRNGKLFVPIGNETDQTKCALYDKQGNMLGTEKIEIYDSLYNNNTTSGKYVVFREETHPIRDDSEYTSTKYGIKDSDGIIIIPAIYDGISDVSNGIALVELHEVPGWNRGDDFDVYYGYADLDGNDTFSERIKDRCKKAEIHVYEEYKAEMESYSYQSTAASGNQNVELSLLFSLTHEFDNWNRDIYRRTDRGGNVTIAKGYNTPYHCYSDYITNNFEIPSGKKYTFASINTSTTKNASINNVYIYKMEADKEEGFPKEIKCNQPLVLLPGTYYFQLHVYFNVFDSSYEEYGISLHFIESDL